MDSIRVIARFRPLLEREEEGAMEVHDNRILIRHKEFSGYFVFDSVLVDKTQEEVYRETCVNLVQDVLNGINGSLLCYGQTGSGKTHTMIGTREIGIIPRISQAIFKEILESSSELEFTVNVSFMEIYMEKIRDLLSPLDKDNLVIHENSNGIYVKDLTQIFVSEPSQMLDILRKGMEGRVTSATKMNDESSRSHAIFIINITSKNTSNGITKSGKLFLVDLAGSEKVSKTGAQGQTLEEAKKINKSLSALGNVINSLTDAKSSHVPYRDSKLTRLLQDSIGGNSKTTLIVNCSPSACNALETISTLRFGVRAKCIKNNVKVNQELPIVELKRLLKLKESEFRESQNYSRKLQDEVKKWRSGVSVPKDQWVKLKDSLRDAGDSKIDLGDVSQDTLQTEERELFLERENQLSDLLAEKETALNSKDAIIQELEIKLQELIERISDLETVHSLKLKENNRLEEHVQSLKVKVESVRIENNEQLEFMGNLKDENRTLIAEITNLSNASRSQSTIFEQALEYSELESVEEILEPKVITDNEMQKMFFLEQSLEQLSKIQKQLVDQNVELKKSVSISEKKLNLRSERIESLEKSLEEAQQKLLISQNNDYGNLNSDRQTINPFSTARIVKPLRGGANVSGPKEISTPGSKKSVWYINLVKTPK